MEHLPIQEEEGAESLILGGAGDVFLHGQVGQECFYFGSAHFGRMAHAVEKDVALDPVDVGLLGADRAMLEADGVANLIQKFFGVLFRHRPFPPI